MLLRFHERPFDLDTDQTQTPIRPNKRFLYSRAMRTLSVLSAKGCQQSIISQDSPHYQNEGNPEHPNGRWGIATSHKSHQVGNTHLHVTLCIRMQDQADDKVPCLSHRAHLSTVSQSTCVKFQSSSRLATVERPGHLHETL